MAIPRKKSRREDRREKLRIECSEEVKFVVEEKTYKGIMDSMGVGGFFIKTDKSFSKGQKVDISFYVRSKEGKVDFSGEIVRTNVKGFAVKIVG